MEKRKISAKIVADSKDERGNRITTYLLTYPRFIHAEVMTHRMFSRNAASSRAIPFAKMVKSVQEDPFIPIAFQKDHKGMQGTEYLEGEELQQAIASWKLASMSAANSAKALHESEVTKQLCNRILEPFLWYTNLVTATEYDNFFELRCPQYYYKPENTYFKSKKDFGSKYYKCFGSDEFIDWDYFKWQSINESHAEIHIQALAEAMWDAKNESEPKTLEAGEWHIPFGDNIDEGLFGDKHPDGGWLHNGFDNKLMNDPSISQEDREDILENINQKVATARCARLSYETHEGEIDYERDIKLHDQLLERKHASCFEHCARMMSDFEYASFIFGRVSIDDAGDEDLDNGQHGWCRNFRGFIPYRHIVKL